MRENSPNTFKRIFNSICSQCETYFFFTYSQHFLLFIVRQFITIKEKKTQNYHIEWDHSLLYIYIWSFEYLRSNVYELSREVSLFSSLSWYVVTSWYTYACVYIYMDLNEYIDSVRQGNYKPIIGKSQKKKDHR